MAASDPESYSWCACSAYVCEELLGGTVEWDQHSLTHTRYYQVRTLCARAGAGEGACVRARVRARVHLLLRMYVRMLRDARARTWAGGANRQAERIAQARSSARARGSRTR